MHDLVNAAQTLEHFLGAGADVVIIYLARVWFRIDKRITRLEWHLFPELRDKL